jgi:hypothetical protein
MKSAMNLDKKLAEAAAYRVSGVAWRERDYSLRIVGKRSGEIAPTPENANILLHTMRQLRGSRGICPRGVYRFKTFEEADEWMIKMIARSTLASRR